MTATLRHGTAYTYAAPVRLGPQILRLRPLPDPRRRCPAFTLDITPTPASLQWLADPYGNHVARFTLADAVTQLDIDVTLQLDLSPINPFGFLLDADASDWPFAYPPEDAEGLAPYLHPGPAGPAAVAMRAETPAAHPTVLLLTALAARVRDRLRYLVREEPGTWSPDQTLAAGEGSCRDFAWLLVQLLRLHGIAARFVSGYLVQDDSAELHAWADAYLPGAGWIGIDATSGYLTAESHVPLAASPHPAAAAPLTGTSEPGSSHLETRITVHRT